MDNPLKQPLVAAALGRQQIEFHSSHVPATRAKSGNGEEMKEGRTGEGSLGVGSSWGRRARGAGGGWGEVGGF